MIITDKKILRSVSTEWSGTPEELEKLLEKMTKAMEERNGIGISAIQIGVPKRIFLAGNPAEVFINPRILSRSSYEKKDWEGCLSCGDAQVRVKRAYSISLEYLNYKDKESSAKKFINDYGNPYNAILVDNDGTNSIELGAYGVPETFIINNKNKHIIKKYIGPLNKISFNEIKQIIKNEIN